MRERMNGVIMPLLKYDVSQSFMKFSLFLLHWFKLQVLNVALKICSAGVKSNYGTV